MKRLLLLSTLIAATAHADVWQHAIDPNPGLDIYEALMNKGNEAAIAANSRSSQIMQVRKDIDTAVEAYRAAAKANPQSAEPYYRIASVLNSFFLDCEDVSIITGNLPPVTCTRSSKQLRDEKAKEAVDAWDKFETLAPLDPRVNDILLTRAITRTKLVRGTVDRALLEGASRDYQAVIDRKDGMSMGDMSTVYGNLAETHMMLGKVDDAITTYVQAFRVGAHSSTMYGLAVALDRDERSADALSVIRSYGIKEYEDFKLQFGLGRVFFVPPGEEEYYFALCDEAFGNFEGSITHWKAFMRSGAHPQFQPRAKEHIDKLTMRKNLHLEVPLTRDLDFIPNPPRRK